MNFHVPRYDLGLEDILKPMKKREEKLGTVRGVNREVSPEDWRS